MPNRTKKIENIIKWTVAVLSYGFIVYTIADFRNDIENLAKTWLDSIKDGKWIWIAGMTALVPLNLSIEAWKWKTLTANLQKLSFRNALRAVVAGQFAGFFTPNRIGEVTGRSMLLKEGNRLKGSSLTITSSVSQTLAVCLIGIPAMMIYISMIANSGITSMTILWTALAFSILCVTYWFIPNLTEYISSSISNKTVRDWAELLTKTDKGTLIKLLLQSVLRYLVFSTQYYMLLRFFMIDISATEGAIFIATNYLIITFVPSMSFSDGAVRAGVASAVFSPVASNSIGVIATGVSAWLINFVVPMLIGSVIWLKTDMGKKDKQDKKEKYGF